MPNDPTSEQLSEPQLAPQLMEERNKPKESILDRVLKTKEEDLHPWEEVILPSKGMYYGGRIPGGIVEVKPMGLYADKVLATQRLVRSGEALEYIFKRYVKLPNDFDCLELLDDDRSFLLYYLRGITHGNSYEFVLTCPQCEGISEHEYDLNELWENATPPNEKLGQEPFSVRLPDLSDQLGEDFIVKVRFLRGHDTNEMLGTVKPSDGLPGRARARKKRDWRNKDKADEVRTFGETLDSTLEKNINKIIVEAGGETSRGKIRQLVDRLHSSDVNSIIEFLRQNSPGIDTVVETDCTRCSATIVTPLPITASFFRPEKRSRPRE
jgi:hypothetical protein